MEKIDVEERVKRGAEYFAKGYNCSQSVVATFADLYGLTPELAVRISASFGGGLGRMRLTCGTVSGMAVLAGLENGSTNPEDIKAKGTNYSLMQDLANQFEEIHHSIICAKLLKLRSNIPVSAIPEPRTQKYYSERPCGQLVESACRIYAEHLNSKS